VTPHTIQQVTVADLEAIESCRAECAACGARRLTWQTAPGNLRARAVYDRVGANREQWLDYWLAV
jgi:RimJ/RimL family protein N-acetyltransferase